MIAGQNRAPGLTLAAAFDIRINDWVENQAGGLIKKLLPEDTLDADTRELAVREDPIPCRTRKRAKS